MAQRVERRSSSENEERWVVDGLEDTPRGRVVRLELPSGEIRDLPLASLPVGLVEGDILAIQDGPDGVSARRLPEDTAERRTAAQSQLDRLNQSSTSGRGEEIDL